MGQLLEENKKSGYPVDPLLFFALMRQESGFAPKSVSPVGAVGLTQIMPGTAKDLGMMNVFMPSYLDEARTFLGRERSLRRQAVALVKEIRGENKLEIEVANLWPNRLIGDATLPQDKRFTWSIEEHPYTTDSKLLP